MTAIAMHGGETVTRAEAAVFFDRLFSLPAADTGDGVLSDVIPGRMGQRRHLHRRGRRGRMGRAEGRPAEGPVLIDSQLYYAGADGYFLKNAYSGSLFLTAPDAIPPATPSLTATFSPRCAMRPTIP